LRALPYGKVCHENALVAGTVLAVLCVALIAQQNPPWLHRHAMQPNGSGTFTTRRGRSRAWWRPAGGSADHAGARDATVLLGSGTDTSAWSMTNGAPRRGT